jgi:hypothetical protein
MVEKLEPNEDEYVCRLTIKIGFLRSGSTARKSKT